MALLATVVLSVAGAAFHWANAGQVVKGSRQPVAHPALSASSLTLPLFFEPNQGQSDARVKFLARGSGYGLFLSKREAVLELQQSTRVGTGLSASPSAPPKVGRSAVSIIHMRLDGASSSARLRGTEQLPGKSSYFIGNDPAKWRSGIPQFARVEYQSIYPGIDLVYYGNQRQLEYDFRVAPGANPNQIALSFQGASVRLDSGDLVLSTAGGDVRFRAPRAYQPSANPRPGANAETPVQGSFRQLADNKIGFAIGPYDHSRELVIDPVLSYSTYFGLGGESLAKVAVDSSNDIYLAFSTTSANLPTVDPLSCCTNLTPGAQNIFIAKLNISANPQLVDATYLGGNGTDSLAGLAVDSAFGIYVAGSTTSTNFPTTSNAFQATATENPTAQHGFLSKLSLSGAVYSLGYSTYLAGNGVDMLTGLAIDTSTLYAYVTGTTTSTDQATGFPATPTAFQICPFEQPGPVCPGPPGPPQFFASKINTGGAGSLSMIYSTYFGGGNPPPPTGTATGGGIAVDPVASNGKVNMYFTGTTNMLGVTGPSGEAKFPLFNAYQTCLDESGKTSCTLTNPTATDAILVKIDPNLPSAPPVYSTYLGGSANDSGTAVAVDTSSNAYVTGATNSTDWACASPCVFGPFSYLGVNGNTNAFIAKVGNQTGSIFPLTFFTWLGGSGPDYGQAIAVDSVQTVHLAGTTFSINPSLPVTKDAIQFQCGGSGSSGVCTGDAFAALIATSTTTGDYVTYLGGSQPDQGTGIAIDLTNAAYVAGSTQSSDFPIPPSPPAPPPFQGSLKGIQDAFVAKIGNSSTLTVTAGSSSPSPNPVPAGSQAAFTFDITNTGPDSATDLNFYAIVPTSGIASTPTAKVTSGGGSCSAAQGNTIPCFISTLAVNATATVEVDVTPSIPATSSQISVSCNFSANGGSVQTSCPSQTDSITDFTITPNPASLTINAGDLASFVLTLAPSSNLGFNGTITMSDTVSPSIVASPSPTFTNTSVTLPGTGSGGSATTTLNIQTVPRPVTTGRLFRRAPLYAALLPIGGLSLIGVAFSVGRRRRWVAVAVLGFVASLILLQPACSSSSSSTTTSGGTQAGKYVITVTASPGTGGSHNTTLTLFVN